MIGAIAILSIIATIGVALSYSKSTTFPALSDNEKPKKIIDIQTEKEFFINMMAHHQAAIDICKDYLKKTTDPNMSYICERIIWQQGYEIFMMKNTMSLLDIKYDPIKGYKFYFKTVFQFYEPDVDNPNVTEDNIPKFKSGILTDEQFMEHMIVHHQVGVNMCNSILKHTASPYVISFAFDIIKEQTKEISAMQHTLKSKTVFKYDSKLLQSQESNLA